MAVLDVPRRPMTETPRNDLYFRVNQLEREVQALKDNKPELVSERVQNLNQSVRELRAEVKAEMTDLRAAMVRGDNSVRRILISFSTGLGIAIIAAIVALIVTGGNP